MRQARSSAFVVALLLLPALLGAAGCTVGQYGMPVDPAAVGQIRRGHTTRADVEAALGPPAWVEVKPEGKRLVRYVYHEQRDDAWCFVPVAGAFLAGWDVRHQQLDLVVDARGVVEDVEFRDVIEEYRPDGWTRKRTARPASTPLTSVSP